ncbi:MAG: methyltransferase domain-containing protein [Paramuribaculum sp.]|nr:methyltransferase domain-containing protein [Paramuribaculum sp.]
MTSETRKRLPEGFLRLIESYGSPEMACLGDALEGEPSVSVRLNPAKGGGKLFANAERVDWCEWGRYMDERPQFTLDPRMHQGRYYVQDASSMIVYHIVRQLFEGYENSAGVVTALDACAAPGGKTTAMADALPEGSLITANEFSPQRASVLKENIAKWGYPFVKVVQGDAKDLGRFSESFDLVLADTPCSGEGMMRKDETAISQWSERLIEQCAARQWDIVEAVWNAVRPGGYLIYSTCTFNRLENEEIAERIVSVLGGESVKIAVDPQWGIMGGVNTDVNCLRFLPGKVKGEGLFVSVFRKPRNEGEGSHKKIKKTKEEKGDEKVGSRVKGWLNAPKGTTFIKDQKNNIIARFPSSGLPSVMAPALKIGTEKGRDIEPSQELAMSQLLAVDIFPRYEVDDTTALSYLRGEALILAPDTPTGYVLLMFEGYPLGFVKNIGKRANNLYPSAWRIRKC